MLTITEQEEDYEDNAKDCELITKVFQMSFFPYATNEDIRKTLFLLNYYRRFKKLILDYQSVLDEEKETGINEYDMSNLEGRAKRLNSTDLISDVTANTVIAKDGRHEIFLVYKRLNERILAAVRNVDDPHESLIAHLLFTGEKKYKYSEAQLYMTVDRRKDIYPIQATTFSERRRKLVAGLAESFLLNKTLDAVIIRYGRGINENGQMAIHPNAYEMLYIK